MKSPLRLIDIQIKPLRKMPSLVINQVRDRFGLDQTITALYFHSQKEWVNATVNIEKVRERLEKMEWLFSKDSICLFFTHDGIPKAETLLPEMKNISHRQIPVELWVHIYAHILIPIIIAKEMPVSLRADIKKIVREEVVFIKQKKGVFLWIIIDTRFDQKHLEEIGRIVNDRLNLLLDGKDPLPSIFQKIDEYFKRVS